MKVKVKVAGQPVPVKKPQTLSAKSDSIFPAFPRQSRPVVKQEKGIFGRMINIVIEDVRSVFHADKKTLEEKMKYEEFMERFGK